MSTAVAQMPFSQRVIEQIESRGGIKRLMPKQMQPMADRYIQTVKLYIATCNHREKLQQCTMGSIVTAILNGAKFGILIDGKQGHLVPFNTKVKDRDGRDKWEMQAQFIPDYKGLINSARRSGLILDASLEHVHENDIFKRRMVNGVWSLEYEPALTDRGDYLGTFGVLLLPDNRFTVAYMTKEEIDHVKNKSKAKDFGPWKDDEPEMRKKTVAKRVLKLYADDPDLLALVEYDNDLLGNDTIDAIATEHKGITKAAPLAIEYDEEPTNFSEQIEQPQPEPAKARKRESKPQEAATTVNNWAVTFGACESRQALHTLKNEILADDPTLEDDAFKAAFAARDAELKK